MTPGQNPPFLQAPRIPKQSPAPYSATRNIPTTSLGKFRVRWTCRLDVRCPAADGAPLLQAALQGATESKQEEPSSIIAWDLLSIIEEEGQVLSQPNGKHEVVGCGELLASGLEFTNHAHDHEYAIRTSMNLEKIGYLEPLDLT